MTKGHDKGHKGHKGQMSDRELLELAAKAAGIKPDWYERGIAINHGLGKDDYHNDAWVDVWNPLADDGDAFRLAVNLGIDIGWGWDENNKPSVVLIYEHVVDLGNDPYAATRRAIVRAAAEIGREK